MKKLSFFLMAMLFSVMSFAAEATATISFANKAQRTVYTTSQQVWEQNGIVVTNDKASSTTNVGDYANPARFYKGSKVTIQCTLGNIKKIEITGWGDSKYNVWATSIGSEAATSGSSVIITPTAVSDTYVANMTGGQARAGQMVITYEVAEGGFVSTPAIEGEQYFKESATVSMKAAEGLKVYYTLDGTDPTTASTEYTASFEVKETTTVKAIASDGENASDVVTVVFKKMQVLTCAEAAAITPNGDKYIVRGYVTSSNAYSTQYNNIDFFVADTKDGGEVLKVYRAVAATEADKAVKAGDYVEVIGELAAYYEKIQIAQGGTYTIIPEPAPEPEHTYTVAGSSATVFGTAWNANDTVNNMTKQEDGTYKLEKTELTLAAGTIEFKVVEDHNWDIAYPGDNYKLTIAEDGIYTITITFNPADKVVAATATKTGDAGKIIPVIAMHGNFLGSWADTEDFTLAADEATATLTLTIAEGNYEFGVRIDGTWTSNGVAFTRENASAEIVAGSGNLKLAADVAGEYTFTWTFETNTLTVTYPALVTTITETFDLTTKDTRNMMGTYNVYAGDYTLRIYGYEGAGTYQDDPATEEVVEVQLFTPDYEDPLNAVVVVTIDEENNKEVMQVTATSADGKKIYNLTINIVAPAIQEHVLNITYPTIKVEESPLGGSMYIIEGEAMMDTEDNIVSIWMNVLPASNYAEMGIGEDIYATGEALVSDPFNGEFTIEATLTDEAGNIYNVTVLAQEIKQDIEIVVADTVELNGYNMTFEMQGNMAIVSANVQGIELFFWMTMYSDDNGYGTYFNDAITNVWYGENALTPYGDEHVYSAENLKVSFINDPDAEGNVTLYNFTLYAGDQPTGVDNINTTVAPVKVIENGQIFIISNGVKYNAQGAKL